MKIKSNILSTDPAGFDPAGFSGSDIKKLIECINDCDSDDKGPPSLRIPDRVWDRVKRPIPVAPVQLPLIDRILIKVPGSDLAWINYGAGGALTVAAGALTVASGGGAVQALSALAPATATGPAASTATSVAIRILPALVSP